ncbi:MAG: hypothetical protein ACREQE_03915 [Candidatus Binataceae bacterium]
MEAGSKVATQAQAKPAALPRYFYRLSARAQSVYLRSNNIERFELTPGRAACAMLTALMNALEEGAPAVVERGAQILVSELCRGLGVRPVRVEVRGVRPRNGYSELHGIFYPRGPARRVAAGRTTMAAEPLIVLWMRTARRHDVVKPKTFVRTLMHELAHYLDSTLLKLGDSYHTAGFFKRESYLVRMLFQPAYEP